jgi:hypothetical protein
LRPERIQTQPTNLTPTENKDLSDLYKACDKTLSLCEKANKDKDDIIIGQQNIIDEQAKELKKSDDGILNSKGLWFIIGAIFTGIITALARK